MSLESIRVSAVIPASAERIYEAWLDSEEHSAFTGGKATVESGVGGRHTAWDGYIEGQTLELEPARRIVQSWRSLDFPPDAQPSRVEVLFAEVPGGTEVTVVHTEIPVGQGEQYEEGWVDHYFKPMAQYFGVAARKPEIVPPLPELSAESWDVPTSVDDVPSGVGSGDGISSIGFTPSIAPDAPAREPKKARPKAAKKPTRAHAPKKAKTAAKTAQASKKAAQASKKATKKTAKSGRKLAAKKKAAPKRKPVAAKKKASPKKKAPKKK
jgi:uncharacterized protein YndB with AHSA1/START domain